MTERGQQVQFFGTPINFANTAKMRLLRLRVGKHNAERIAAWYMQMRDLAKQGTTFGEFTTNTVLFVDSLGGDVPSADQLDAFVDECASMWAAFQAVGLVDIEGELRATDDLFRVTVCDYAETNVSRSRKRDVTPMSDADRQAKRRENKRRRDSGMPEMSDEEAESFLASRNVTSRVTASRHVTLTNNQTSNSAEPGCHDAVTLPLLEHVANENQAIDAEERFVPAAQRIGIPVLHADVRDLASRAHPHRHAPSQSGDVA